MDDDGFELDETDLDQGDKVRKVWPRLDVDLGTRFISHGKVDPCSRNEENLGGELPMAARCGNFGFGFIDNDNKNLGASALIRRMAVVVGSI